MSGIANSLIALTPLRDGTGPGALAALAAFDAPAPSPFARVPGTHFARWSVVGRLPGPDGAPLPDGPEYLLTCADFDPPLPVWARGLCEYAGTDVDTVMSFAVGWPGCASPGAVAEFLAAHHAPAGFTVSTYGRATVGEVRAALALRRSLRALAVRAQNDGLDPGALRAAWRRTAGP